MTAAVQGTDGALIAVESGLVVAAFVAVYGGGCPSAIHTFSCMLLVALSCWFVVFARSPQLTVVIAVMCRLLLCAALAVLCRRVGSLWARALDAEARATVAESRAEAAERRATAQATAIKAQAAGNQRAYLEALEEIDRLRSQLTKKTVSDKKND
jgi:endonuclease/exonuclease/phosphatase (EEP) superfamily protein YafD